MISRACFILIFILVFQTLAHSKSLLIEMSAIIDKSGHIDSNIDSIVRVYKYRDNSVSVVSFQSRNKNKEDIIKSRFLISKFYYGKRAVSKILSEKNKNNIYAESDSMLSLLNQNNIKYVQVINDTQNAYDIGINNLLRLKNQNGRNIIIADNIKENIGVKIKKSNVIVLDGDTIVYNDIHYRLLGVDAPEIEQYPHGEIASNFVYNKIQNADNVYINVSNYDIYDRVLSHIFINNDSLSVILIENSLAIQTITTYGDNGFEHIADKIMKLSKNRKRLPFLSPRTFRQKNKK